MSTYRKMRRQARLARRSGLQPMMMINAGEPFPETLGVLLARWAWRYRSELAPLGVTAGLVAAAWWLHHTRPHWWPFLAVVTGVATWAVALFGARWRLPTRLERIYAAVTIYAGGTWLCAATAVGPSVPLLREALIIGVLLLSVPWWAHRRRRAKVALERKLQAWPDIAKTIGLAGAEVMSATVDVWGWRARFRLARGQTIKEVTAKIPAIESGLGTFRNAVRVYPTPDDLANRCEIRVLNMDPHAGSIPWPGPSVTSITQPVVLGLFEDAALCQVVFARLHGILGGTTGSGKSGGLNEGYSGTHDVMRSLSNPAACHHNKNGLFMKGFSYHTQSAEQAITCIISPGSTAKKSSTCASGSTPRNKRQEARIGRHVSGFSNRWWPR